MTVDTLITIIYGMIGASGALAIVVFLWGFVEYITKIGLPSVQRDKGVGIMEWGVRLIVTSVFLVLALQLVEKWLG